jgi:hypothetical protein
VELRERRRYRLALPVTYLWGSSESLLEGTGDTRDISVSSVYVTTDDPVPAGIDLWFQVTLPPIREGARGSILEGTGRIVRSDPDGFAAVVSIGFPVDLWDEGRDGDEIERSMQAKRKAASVLAGTRSA